MAKAFELVKAMSSKYTVWTAFEIRTGEIALSGSVSGPLLSIGKKGTALTSSGCIEVDVMGTGVSDRMLQSPDRQGILVRVSKGEAALLSGVTIEFP